jgi:hypothetical protein
MSESNSTMDAPQFKFWMVWVPKPNHGAPFKRHPTYESAKAEAMRLAEKEGQPAFVLECVGVAERQTPPIVWKDAQPAPEGWTGA